MLTFTQETGTALILGGESVAFAQLRTAIEARKPTLAAAADGGIFVLSAERRLTFVVDFLALLELGLPQAIMSPEWTAAEAALRSATLGRCQRIDADGNMVTIDSCAARHHPETAVVLFTSGSTGNPRAVQLSRGNVEANVRAVIASLDFATVPQQLLFLPLSYSFGLLGQLLPALALGIPTRLLQSLVELKFLFDAGDAAGMISGVPSHYETLLRLLGDENAAYPAISHIVSAGAALHVPTRQRLQRLFPAATIYTNYGQTEAAPRILCLKSDNPHFLSGATGYPVGNLRARCSEEGELQVSGDQIMLGYLGEVAASAAKVRDGWLQTGDLASIADDGLVTIRGRLDDLFKVGGERIGPQEIEQALLALPGVAEAAVFIEDEALYGGSIGACLQAGAGGFALSKRDIVRELGKTLSKHKIPARYFLLPTLPKSENGKILRRRLPEALQGVEPLA